MMDAPDPPDTASTEASPGDTVPRRQVRPADVMLATAFQLTGFLLALVAVLALLDAALSRRPIAGWVAVVSAVAALGLLIFSRRLGRR